MVEKFKGPLSSEDSIKSNEANINPKRKELMLDAANRPLRISSIIFLPKVNNEHRQKTGATDISTSIKIPHDITDFRSADAIALRLWNEEGKKIDSKYNIDIIAGPFVGAVNPEQIYVVHYNNDHEQKEWAELWESKPTNTELEISDPNISVEAKPLSDLLS